MPYAVPDDDIVAIVDAPPTPAMSPSPDGRTVLLVHYESHPPVELLARSVLRLGGVRIDPERRSRQRTLRLVGLTLVDVGDGTHRAVRLPDDAAVSVPAWSPDSARFAFTVDRADGIGVWVGDVASASAAPVEGLTVSDVLTGGQLGGGDMAVGWSRDGRSLLALAVPADASPLPPARIEPHVDETSGKSTQMATFQDLLASAADADAFEVLGTTQLVRVDPASGKQTALGAPGLLHTFHESPDGRHLLVERVRRPFSFRVPYPYFSRVTEVWSADDGHLEATVADLPVSDEVPRQGVPTGPREVVWQERAPATALWREALDGGDPTVAAEHRDRIMRLPAPFSDAATEVRRTHQRCLGWWELDDPGRVLVVEHDRDRRWRTTRLVDLDGAPEGDRVLFDLSVHDAYGDPGTPLQRRHPDGTSTVLQVDGAMFLRGSGATPEGNRPFLDRFDLATAETSRLHASPAGALEPVVALVEGGTAVLVRRESRSEPPNLFVRPLGGGEPRRLTEFPDPHPQLTGMVKQLRTHERPDGVSLSGVLHLPPGHDPERDGRLPLLLWAYPLDYGDAGTAGQVRGSDQGFTRLSALGPAFFVLRGYAVLADATMPVVGDPETMNDTYIEQVTAAAAAHIDALDADGIIDRRRVVVGGHSYGGFMTANLVAHTDLFAAGIARSGAYNRTLTPFGFQTERRSFWEAPSVYDAVSPFRAADRIRTPLLLIHGAADNNPGTFPVQSERLFQAIQGNGGTARLVLLPHESHGYLGRESVLHVLAEQLAWAERWTAPAG
jgi:dipeptidyl aminopeptidase/acylaminoacyl peptidase